jgi:hypothetical protein
VTIEIHARAPAWRSAQAGEESGARHIDSAAWQFRPAEDFARAAAADLQASGLFKEAYFAERPSDAYLVVTGNIRSTNYSGSVYSPLLWLFGLPAASVENNDEAGPRDGGGPIRTPVPLQPFPPEGDQAPSPRHRADGAAEARERVAEQDGADAGQHKAGPSDVAIVAAAGQSSSSSLRCSGFQTMVYL